MICVLSCDEIAQQQQSRSDTNDNKQQDPIDPMLYPHKKQESWHQNELHDGDCLGGGDTLHNPGTQATLRGEGGHVVSGVNLMADEDM